METKSSGSVSEQKSTRVEFTQVSVDSGTVSSVKEPEVVDIQRAELERLTRETEMAFKHLEVQSGIGVDKKLEDNDPLAPKKIEKLFKQSGSERSPFAS